MVLNGATEHEELTLMPINGFGAACESELDYVEQSGFDGQFNPLPVFIFGDDDNFDDEDDSFDDEDDSFDDEDDRFDDEEVEEDEDDRFDDDEDEDDDDKDDDDDDDDDYDDWGDSDAYE